jgi:molybdate transport system substrate-binding protein
MPVFSLKKIFFLLCLTLLPLNIQAEEPELPSLTVLADRALSVPLTQLASQFSRRTHSSVTLSYAPSFEQTIAVQEGEPADLILSAHPKTFIDLREALKEDSLTPLVTARLALVTSTDYPDDIVQVSLDDLRAMRRREDFLLAVAIPAATAEGYYAEQILSHLRSRMFLASQTVQLQNTSETLTFLAGTPAFGIVLEPDILQSQQIRMLAVFPQDWHHSIIFRGAIVARGNVALARKFLHHLQTTQAKQLFEKYRLTPVIRNSRS